MSELTDDQLDGLFRKSAEEFDPQFDPAAWQDMKSRLDNNDRTRPGGAMNWKNLFRWGLPILLLLLLTGGGWYMYQKTNGVSKPTTVSRKTTPVLTKEKTAEKGYQPELSRLTATNLPAPPTVDANKLDIDKPERSVDRTGLTAGREESINRPVESIKETVATVTIPTKRATKPASTSYSSGNETNYLAHTTRIGEPSTVVKTEKATNRLRKPTVLSNSLARPKQRRIRQPLMTFSTANHAITATRSFTDRQPKKRQPIDSHSTLSIPEETSAIEPITDASKPVIELSELAIRPARWPQPLAFVGRPVVEAPDTVTRKVVSTTTVPRGLSIRFAVSPDLSTVGLKNFARPGTNIGLLLEYRLASHWSVQAGVVRSTKVYDATAGQYGYWPDYINKWMTKPIGVEGTCMIIDIPVNVRYDAIIKPRLDNKQPSRWFVSTGITSYVMKQEEYTFKYSDYTHVYPNMIGESASTGGYGFSHVNLSVGYERAINRRLSWQVEPFMKVPLKGVGYFKIDLISTGAFFSIRYKL